MANQRIRVRFFSTLFYFKRIIKRIANLLERFAIMYIPFLSSIFYVVHTILMKNGVTDTLFYGYNANTFGHSIMWLTLVLLKSKRMCKWYKLSIIFSMCTNVLNILYYHKIIPKICLIDIAFSFVIASIISWLIFRLTYKTTKVIHSECKRLKQE